MRGFLGNRAKGVYVLLSCKNEELGADINVLIYSCCEVLHVLRNAFGTYLTVDVH